MIYCVFIIPTYSSMYNLRISFPISKTSPHCSLSPIRPIIPLHSQTPVTCQAAQFMSVDTGHSTV